MNKPQLLVFNSGSGSGFQKLVENSRLGVLQADIVGLVTNNINLPCVERAKKLGIEVYLLEKFEAEDYQKVVSYFKADFVALSGWLKLVKGLDPRTTINIHPGPLPEFGGPGMYGHFVHEAMVKAFKAGQVTKSEISMHFVTEKYDRGPVIFRYPVMMYPDDTASSVAANTNVIELGWQSFVTNLVVTRKIRWDGKNPKSLVVPSYMKSFL